MVVRDLFHGLKSRNLGAWQDKAHIAGYIIGGSEKKIKKDLKVDIGIVGVGWC